MKKTGGAIKFDCSVRRILVVGPKVPKYKENTCRCQTVISFMADAMRTISFNFFTNVVTQVTESVNRET